MNDPPAFRRGRLWLYAALTLILLGCLWVGWRDFDPRIPQDEVRENIRSSIRWIVQSMIQYLIPAAILVYFSCEAIAKFRSRLHKPGTAAKQFN